MQPTPFKLWDLIDLATRVDDALTLHLTVGRPPMVRVAEQGLRPLDDSHPILTGRSVSLLLSPVVEPEAWERIERVGEGEVVLTPPGSGRAMMLTLFRNSEAWSVVVHL